MGNHPNITHDKFPTQGSYLNRRVKVCFHYDTTKEHTIYGTIVRDDSIEPGIGIIRLDNGNHVLFTECQYNFPVEDFKEKAE